MCGCGCGCRDGWPGARRGPSREDRIRWLQEYQRDLEQQAAEAAEEIRRLQEAQAAS
jgi:hypothetical protein